MDKNPEKRSQNRLQVEPAAAPSLAQSTPNVAGLPAGGLTPSLAPIGEPSGLRFPPTRAARASRGRGVFLEEIDEVVSGARERWVEVPVAIVALAVAAFAVTVFINAPSAVAGGAFGANPGPALVAAASVAPPFVLPAKLR